MIRFLKIVLIQSLFFVRFALAFQVVPSDFKKCSTASDCFIVYDNVCGMPESINKTKKMEWKKIEQASFSEDKKKFPNGHECKIAPGKVIAVCSNSSCGWKVPSK